ncbi:hypothetical protein [Variovorax paradoxus]
MQARCDGALGFNAISIDSSDQAQAVQNWVRKMQRQQAKSAA